ncbi:MAG TPA: hypothetical protein DCL17_06180 [Dehalococcoidia bacterium]|nr:hypothetical protein [Dehalococcoidia bacterium]
MMSDPASDLTKSFKRYLHAFNQRDVEGLLAEMHFPHMRLVDDVFQRWETSDGMAEMEENVAKSLKSEGWHTSEAKLIEAVQVGPEKEHLANRMSRLKEDGTEYNTFDTP